MIVLNFSKKYLLLKALCITEITSSGRRCSALSRRRGFSWPLIRSSSFLKKNLTNT